ncbi:MAG: chemotaxis protein CheA [Spirochaetota bacterium]|nr:chemotaxis protein CheA [Spirochaetota bacterium]
MSFCRKTMNSFNDKLDKISQNIILMEEGDLFSLNNVYDSLEYIYPGLIELNNERVSNLADSLIKLLDSAIKSEITNFSLLVKYLSDSTNLIREIINNGKSDSNESIDKLINNINFLLSGSEQEIKPIDIKAKKEIDFSEDLELYNNFIIETSEYLDNVEAQILNLEQNPMARESIDEIFRAFHTIKGVSGFLKLDDLNFLAHELESLLEYVKENNILMDGNYLDFLLDYTDMVRDIINSIKEKLDGKDSPLTPIDRQLITDRIFKLLSNEKSINRKKLGEIILEQGNIDENSLNESMIKSKQENKKLGELLLDEKKINAKQLAQALRRQTESTTVEKAEISNKKTPSTDLSTIKVNANKLDSLLDAVGELVISHNQISQNPFILENKNNRILKDINHLGRVVSELQKLSMSLRMVEIRPTFQKMNRLVRDLSQKLSKPINLIITGEDTEIDRSIVDEISDPLIHILRNTIDHGIETEKERIAKNKDKIGSVNLSAYHQGGNVIIEVKDDGKGLDRKKILQKAIDMGIVSNGDNLSEHEINNLLFHTGLSTAEEVTDVSGRGVGMNIVKEKINKIRGIVELFSEPDKGTKFIMKIPLTMAIIDGVVISIGKNKYILPSIHIKQIFKLDSKKYFTYKQEGEMIDINGLLVPLVRLYKLFKVEPTYNKPEDGLIILVENETKQKCFMLDDIIGKQEIVVKSLGERLRNTEGISAATILGDGKVGLILDVKGIFNWQENLKSEKISNNKTLEYATNEI